MSYAALERLKEVLSIEDRNSDAPLQRALDAATDWIISYTGRQFSISGTQLAPVTLTLYPDSATVLRVPDLQTLDSLTLDTTGDRTFATSLVSTDYQLWPLDGPPYTEIRIWPTAAHGFDTSEQVQVAGTFGYGATVPAQVELACLLLATRWYKRHEAPFGILQSVDLGQFERIRADDPDIAKLLDPFKAPSGSASSPDWILV